MLGLIYSFAYVLLIILEEGIVIWSGGLGFYIQSDPENDLILDLTGLSGTMHKFMQEPGV